MSILETSTSATPASTPGDGAAIAELRAAFQAQRAAQGALPSLAFGGVGASGMGRHHGFEGFREFSNPRGVVVRGAGDQFDAFAAPYAKAAALVKAALG